ncbi:MAG TPA: hypothetical protein VK427_22090, partial [Kofleriaceae bacterium]|nr:hypothetical protein [Kofleriaceae bacterium]
MPDFEDGPPTARFPHGTARQIKLASDELAPVVSAADLMTFVAELRTSTSSVLFETALLGDTATSPPVAHGLARIVADVRAIERVTAELADLAAIQENRLVVRPRPNEMRSLLHEVVERVTSSPEHPQITIEAPPACLVHVDAMRIERVIATLLRRALREAPHGSHITVRLVVDN